MKIVSVYTPRYVLVSPPETISHYPKRFHFSATLFQCFYIQIFIQSSTLTPVHILLVVGPAIVLHNYRYSKRRFISKRVGFGPRQRTRHYQYRKHDNSYICLVTFRILFYFLSRFRPCKTVVGSTAFHHYNLVPQLTGGGVVASVRE